MTATHVTKSAEKDLLYEHVWSVHVTCLLMVIAG